MVTKFVTTLEPKSWAAITLPLPICSCHSDDSEKNIFILFFGFVNAYCLSDAIKLITTRLKMSILTQIGRAFAQLAIPARKWTKIMKLIA